MHSDRLNPELRMNLLRSEGPDREGLPKRAWAVASAPANFSVEVSFNGRPAGPRGEEFAGRPTKTCVFRVLFPYDIHAVTVAVRSSMP